MKWLDGREKELKCFSGEETSIWMSKSKRISNSKGCWRKLCFDKACGKWLAFRMGKCIDNTIVLMLSYDKSLHCIQSTVQTEQTVTVVMESGHKSDSGTYHPRDSSCYY